MITFLDQGVRVQVALIEDHITLSIEPHGIVQLTADEAEELSLKMRHRVKQLREELIND